MSVRKAVVVLVGLLLVLNLANTLSVPKAYAWKVLSYETCRGYDANTYACIDPTNDFTTTDKDVWIHAEFDFSDIPSTVNFNSISQWQAPNGRVYQQDQYQWSGGDAQWISNRNLEICGRTASSLLGTWTVSYSFDGGPFGHNLLIFSHKFVVRQEPGQCKGSLVRGGSNGYVIGAELKVPYVENAPDVSSGKCVADQWKNAETKQMFPFTGDNSQYLKTAKGYMMLEYDEEGLYLCGDYVSQTKENFGAGMHIVIDNMHDGIPKPYNNQLKDDVELHAVIGSTSGSFTRIDKHSYTNTPGYEDAIWKTSLGKSPNIVCDDSSDLYSDCHLTDGYTETNIMWTAFIPMKFLEYYSNPANANAKGVYTWFVVGDGHGDGFEYPQGSLATNDYFELADLAFLPEGTTATSVSSTATKVSSTSSMTASSNKPAVASSSISVPISFANFAGWSQYLVAIALVLIGVGLAIYQRSKKKPQ